MVAALFTPHLWSRPLYPSGTQAIFDSTLQLFLNPRALYIIVVDMVKAVHNVEGNAWNPLEGLGVLEWVRHLAYSVPKAPVVLVGTKCDLVKDTPSQSSVDRLGEAAATVEMNIRSAISSRAANAAARKSVGSLSSSKQFPQIRLEEGMSLVSLVEPVGLPGVDDGNGWPYDLNKPGLLTRIFRDSSNTKRKVSMRMPLPWQRASEFLFEYATNLRQVNAKIKRGFSRNADILLGFQLLHFSCATGAAWLRYTQYK